MIFYFNLEGKVWIDNLKDSNAFEILVKPRYMDFLTNQDHLSE